MTVLSSRPSEKPSAAFSLTLRLMAWVLVVLVLLWLAAGAVVWWDVRHEVTELVAQLPLQGEVGEMEHDRREILNAIVQGLLWPLVWVLPLMGALVVVVIYRSLAPLRRMRDALAQRNAQDLQPLSCDGIPKEVLPVWNEINALLIRVVAGMEQEKRFTADAAHELRTPVAAMRAQAQVARMSVAPADRDHALEQVMLACDRAGRLIDQLLALSRLEEQGVPVPATKVDLVPLVRGLMAEMADSGRNVWRLEGLESAPVWVDPHLCRIVLRNLLDNAMRYSPQGATIAVELSRQGMRTTLRVHDSGPGMTPAQQARLGERFFRADPMRAPGSGLGWSIVKRIALNQQFSVSTTTSPSLGGLAIDLVFTEPEKV